MKKSQVMNLLSVLTIKAHADSVTVATSQGQTNGGTLFSDGVRLVYSREIEFKALPLMRFSQFATQKTELGVEPGLTISMLTYDNLSQYVSRVADSSKMVHVECLTSANEVMNLINEDNKLLDEIKKYIWDNMETDVSLNSIASYLHYNPSYLSRLFKQKYDCNIKDFILNTKLKKGESLLVNTDLFVKEIAQKLGFDSISHFFRLFKNVYGVSPNEYRAKYQTKIKK